MQVYIIVVFHFHFFILSKIQINFFFKQIQLEIRYFKGYKEIVYYLSDNKVKRYLFNIVVRILTDLCIDFSTIFCYHTVMRFVK